MKNLKQDEKKARNIRWNNKWAVKVAIKLVQEQEDYQAINFF